MSEAPKTAPSPGMPVMTTEDAKKIQSLPLPPEIEKIFSQARGTFFGNLGTMIDGYNQPITFLVKALSIQINQLAKENDQLKTQILNLPKNRDERRKAKQAYKKTQKSQKKRVNNSPTAVTP